MLDGQESWNLTIAIGRRIPAAPNAPRAVNAPFKWGFNSSNAPRILFHQKKTPRSSRYLPRVLTIFDLNQGRNTDQRVLASSPCPLQSGCFADSLSCCEANDSEDSIKRFPSSVRPHLI
jgi:hypothetical protein